MRLSLSSFAVCLCLALLSLSAVIVSAFNSYGTLYSSYTCPYATGIALYGSAPNNFYMSCYGYGLVRIIATGPSSWTSSYTYNCHGATAVAVNPWTGLTYGACALSGVISWDPTAGIVTTLATPTQCLYPSSVAVNPSTNTVYAACGLGGGVISIVGTSAPTTVLTAAQCPTATAVVVDLQSGLAYAGCAGVGVLLLRPGFSPLTVAGSDMCASPQSLTVHPNMDVVYAVCAPSGGKGASLLTIIGDAVQSYPLGSCSDPRNVAVDMYGDQIYVACGSSGGVVALDPVSNILSPVVPAGACHTATGVAAATSGSGAFVYVTCSSPTLDTGAASSFYTINYPAAVIGIDVKTTVLATSAQCPQPWDLAVDSYQNIAYIGCGYGYGILAASGNTYTSSVVVNTTYCNEPLGLTVNSNSATLYVSCATPGGISSVTNPNPSGALGPLPFTFSSFVPANINCWYAGALALDTNNGELYAGCYGGEIGVSLYNPATIIHVGNNAACNNPSGIAVNPNTVPPTVYSACGYNNLVLNNSTPLLSNSAICADATDVVVNPANGLVYVACYGNSAVLAILPNGTVNTITTATQCQYPYDLSINQNSGVVYVACYMNGILSISTTYNAPYTVAPVYSVATVLPFTYCQYARGVAANPYYAAIYALCGNSAVGGAPAPSVILIYPY